ncbi:MAG: hypothetical protein WCH34_14890 [Bacteroidota bacterium]
MKKVIKFAVLILAVIAFNSCSKSGKPEDVAEKFFKHLTKLEYDDAKAIGTEATGKMLDMMKSMTTMGGDEAKKQMEEAKKAEIKIENMKCDVKEDKALCTFKATVTGKDSKEEKLDLIKKDGKWLVDMKKEDSMGGGSTPPAEAPADSTATTAPAVK